MIYWESYIYEENVVEVEMLKASWNKYWKGFLEQMMFEFDLKKKSTYFFLCGKREEKMNSRPRENLMGTKS